MSQSIILKSKRTHINFRQGLCPLVVWQVCSISCIRLQFIFVLLVLLSFRVRLEKWRLRWERQQSQNLLLIDTKQPTFPPVHSPPSLFLLCQTTSLRLLLHSPLSPLLSFSKIYKHKKINKVIFIIERQWFTCDRASRLPDFTLSSSDWSFSASSSVSSWILGPSSFFFFLSSSASLAALSAFSFFSFSRFICFSLWAFCASLLWWAKASLTSWKKETARNGGLSGGVPLPLRGATHRLKCHRSCRYGNAAHLLWSIWFAAGEEISFAAEEAEKCVY